MRIVVASDSFKGSLSSMQVADAVEAALPECTVTKIPMADGGEGTLDCLCSAMHGKKISVKVVDPLLRSYVGHYALLPNDIAFVELADASGLLRLALDERNPLLTSTFGTGLEIADAIKRGCRRIILSLGGSATNDAGIGLLSALGYRFLDESHHFIPPCGASLGKIFYVDDSSSIAKGVQFDLICDVTNPFFGKQGAAFVYAPQKGANVRQVEILDLGLKLFASFVKKEKNISLDKIPGSGAAGGVGGGLLAFLDAKLISGAPFVLDILQFEQYLPNVDWIITGEGCIDAQSCYGKTLSGIAQIAERYNIPVLALGGIIRETVSIPGITNMVQITPCWQSLSDAMSYKIARQNIIDTVQNFFDSVESKSIKTSDTP